MLEDGAVAVGKAIDWSDIANGAVKAHLVVIVSFPVNETDLH